MDRVHVVMLSVWGLLWAGLAPRATADVWNKETTVKLSEPVEVPGAVLEPGRYVFRLVDSPSNRNIVRITNENENRVQATILAIPKYRSQPAEETVLTFDERPSGRPQALRSWFYPGDTVGQEFAYPKERAVLIAQATRQRVPEAPAAPAAEPSPAPTPAPSPAAAEPARPQERPAEEPSPANQAKPAEEKAGTKAGTEEMPATASYLPLAALLGPLSVAAAIGIRFFRSRAC
jgi:hypothetical protein